jgi:T5orf172 domain
MTIEFEPTKSFCYRFARYELLDEITKEPEAISGASFKMLDVSKRVIERHFSPEQLAIEIPAAEADRIDTIYGTLKFFVALHAKRLPNSPFVWIGNGGMYRLKSDVDIQQEMEETELDAEADEEVTEFDGWIYAFSFPVLIKDGFAFPIKIGMTIKDVELRVAYQCKSSATFENPVILSRWQVKRVGAVESAIHATLKSRGKWRENVPGTEWFDTTLSEIETIVKFITQL